LGKLTYKKGKGGARRCPRKKLIYSWNIGKQRYLVYYRGRGKGKKGKQGEDRRCPGYKLNSSRNKETGCLVIKGVNLNFVLEL